LAATVGKFAPVIAKVLACFPSQRRCPWDPPQTFWVFLHQTLSQGACRESVEAYRALCAAKKQRVPSPNTGARARLDPAMLNAIEGHVRVQGQQAERRWGRWHGWHVRIVDGATVSMPDTPENQSRYPQPKGQKAGGGFPVLQMVGVFSWASGMLLEEAHGSLHAGEWSLFRSLRRRLPKRTLILSDRFLSGYADLYALTQARLPFVVRKHACRTVGARLKKVFGQGDRLVEWTQPVARPKHLSVAQYKALPERMLLREVDIHVTIPGFRVKEITVVTCLLDPVDYCAEEIRDLFRDRWGVETNLRQLKTMLGAEILSCQSPAMIDKELTLYRIVYNLVRWLMLQSAKAHGLRPNQLSFTHALGVIRQWSIYLALASERDRHRLYRLMLSTLAQAPLPYRPNRSEPRAVKRRPKNYQRLTKPRHEFQETPHRNRYRKAQ